MSEELLLKLVLSILFGGLIGLERQYHHKAAGFRTMIMISIGSCLFTILSAELVGTDHANRIAANIVTGIGFLGAGVIFRSANRVNGITTAAAIWTVAAGGMAVGAGYYALAGITALFIITVLAILPYAEKKIDAKHLYMEYNVVYAGEKEVKDIWQMLGNNKLKYEVIRQVWSPGEVMIIMEVWGRPEDHQRFIASLQADKALRKLECY